jgi:ABC-2 type transport system permease protein
VRADWSSVTWGTVALAVPAVAGAAFLNFLGGYCVAMIAFWTQKNNAINQLYWSLAWFLGGRIAPLAVMPPFIRAAAAWLPFQTMYSFPIEAAMGRQSLDTVLHNYALQVVWILLGLVAWRLIWRAGLRQYSAVGA